ncbi:voltage-dependent calcium channel subunit alpha-2/delta-3 isoform X3 [Chrysoperla carnea]|uniref:voltage-dependent calcium channel subunit alpha-2/delta-3 isoform X3 n=1 Tax=Chrysoperla carnea TaxID=189513 RepID=UPI001D05FE6F|nr:voltage-dependent calcium channel subunit alpha-2/delta-3 isoform X3 [Chrysoperla carnea]
MLRNGYLFGLFFLCSLIVRANFNPNVGTINVSVVSTWAQKLGGELFNFGEYVTRMKQVEESYKLATLVERDGSAIVQDIAKEINLMMDLKISAIKRIMDSAESAAITEQNENVPSGYAYFNAKNLVPPPENDTVGEGYREMKLTPNEHFYNLSVNVSHSAVHVPTNVYDRSQEVIKAIKWSENLDSIFKSNYDADPSLSWQYFGSSTGFMRQFPAMEWKQEPVDLFDCRTRSWYIEAATSPKDVVILVDNSGSMTGLRKEIARHVVNNILDTLGNNDYVNIFSFANETLEIVPCFEGLLVQATLANVRELKIGMESIETNNIANFTAALIKSFELLLSYRREKEGARCNQAIMLITDGVPYNFKEIFEHYNWQELPSMPVRVFTYLIGREVADVREVKWMACANQGYYVHLSTFAEVREQVLQYVPVMARPMVLSKSEHPVIWTPVYADVTDPKMTDWLWEIKEREEQKESIQSYRKNKQFFKSKEEQDRRFVEKQKRKHDQHGDMQSYKLMTSVSMPVFDRRELANITENILVNEANWVTITRETRVANLLGVAGTDIPIQDIQRLMMPHILGVNGYAFIVTNNGFILIHPDLRPVFQGILKPSYNSVDMAEVELIDDNREPRNFDPMLLELRDAVINQSIGRITLSVKYHYDDMRRVSKMRRQYYYYGMKNTPFSLVIAIPETYGQYRVQIPSSEDIHRLRAQGKMATEFFKENWIIHPDWTYCKYLRYDPERRPQFSTPEQELLHFLDRMNTGPWKWLKRTAFPPEMTNTTTGKSEKVEKDSYFCDRDLMQSLVWDAKITSWFSNNITDTPKEDKRNEFIQRYGLTIVFVSTHSGLTRWQDFPSPRQSTSNEPHFSEIYKRAIDETWYKRAVEHYFINPRSFVYSVPFDVGDKKDTLVTATHAIVKTENGREKIRAPAAVVGFQFLHSALYTLFKNITSSCGGIKPCQKTCTSVDLDCYILDNNGYIIVSENMAHTGRFFGEVDGFIMELLIQEHVYRKVQIVDYQAVCFEQPEVTNPASHIPTPLMFFKHIMQWAISYTIWMFAQTTFIFSNTINAFSYASEDISSAYEAFEPDPTVSADQPPVKINEKEFDIDSARINQTRPKPCDMDVTLYEMRFPKDKKAPYPFGQPSHCKGGEESPRPFVVEQISNSNMILLVVDALCKRDENVGPIITLPQEYKYNGSDTLSCFKVRSPELSRRRPSSCISSHMNESEIELCGKGNRIENSLNMLLSILFVFITRLFIH